MHEGERAGGKRREASDRASHGRIETRIAEQVLRCDRGPDDIVEGEGGPIAELGEKVAAVAGRAFECFTLAIDEVWNLLWNPRVHRRGARFFEAGQAPMAVSTI